MFTIRRSHIQDRNPRSYKYLFFSLDKQRFSKSSVKDPILRPPLVSPRRIRSDSDGSAKTDMCGFHWGLVFSKTYEAFTIQHCQFKAVKFLHGKYLFKVVFKHAFPPLNVCQRANKKVITLLANRS